MVECLPESKVNGRKRRSVQCKEDINECERENKCSKGENSVCNNVIGGYYCTCTIGYSSISEDDSICKDSTMNAVLVLSTYESTNKPMIVDIDGE